MARWVGGPIIDAGAVHVRDPCRIASRNGSRSGVPLAARPSLAMRASIVKECWGRGRRREFFSGSCCRRTQCLRVTPGGESQRLEPGVPPALRARSRCGRRSSEAMYRTEADKLAPLPRRTAFRPSDTACCRVFLGRVRIGIMVYRGDHGATRDSSITCPFDQPIHTVPAKSVCQFEVGLIDVCHLTQPQIIQIVLRLLRLRILLEIALIDQAPVVNV